MAELIKEVNYLNGFRWHDNETHTIVEYSFLQEHLKESVLNLSTEEAVQVRAVSPCLLT